MFRKIVIVLVVSFGLIQFLNPKLENPKVDKSLTLEASSDVMGVLKRSCYDCHSFETKFSEYAKVAPFSFVVMSHIKDGRKALNFSKWKTIDKEIKIARLKRLIVTTHNHMMPLPSYLFAHKDASLSKKDIELLSSWAEVELKKLNKE